MRQRAGGATRIVGSAVIAVALAQFPSHVRAQDPAGDESCMGRRATIVSDEREIHGTPSDDVIVGKAGRQDIRGGAGDDLICGRGRDRIHGDDGDDLIRERTGYGHLMGGDGDDELVTRGGILNGQAGNDLLHCFYGFAYGGAGDDHVRMSDWCVSEDGPGDDVHEGPGHAGDRRIRAVVHYRESPRGVTIDLGRDRATGSGHDTLLAITDVYGSPFSDRMIGDGHKNWLWGVRGSDVIEGGGSRDALEGGAGAETIFGGSGNDTLFGGSFLLDAERRRSRLAGGPGDDFLIGGAAEDLLAGGPGSDTIGFPESASVEVNLAEQRAKWDGTDKVLGMENIAAGYGSDELIGNDRDNLITFGTYQEGDVVSAGGGDDQLWDYYGGSHTLDGGTGVDLVGYSTAGPLTIDLAAGTAESSMKTDALSGIENVSGSFFDDEIHGNAEDNEVLGLDGNDRIFGREGDDSLDGGEGTDSLDGGEGADSCLGGEVLLMCETTKPRPSRDVSLWLRRVVELRAREQCAGHADRDAPRVEADCYFASPRPFRPGYSRPPNGNRAERRHASSFAKRSR